MKKRVWVLLLNLWFGKSYSYIYDVMIMKRWNIDTHSYQYIIGCSDYHDATHSMARTQRAELLAMVCRANKTKTLVIVEDLGSPNESGCYSCDALRLTSTKGLLASFALICRTHDIDVRNIEYRYARVISLSDIVSHPEKSPYESKSACKVKVDQLVSEVLQTIDIIRSYQDCLSLTLCYHRICQSIKKGLHRLQLIDMKEESVALLCDQQYYRPGFIKQLLTFDSRLLDCKGVHAIVNARHKDKIVLLAGGTHIERMGQMLASVGFELVYQTHQGRQHQGSLSRAMSIAQSTRYNKPSAVALGIVREYLHR